MSLNKVDFNSRCPGAFVEGFNSGRFAVFILAEINIFSYFNDAPILMQSISPDLAGLLSTKPLDVVPTIDINGVPVTNPQEAVDLNAGIQKILADAEKMATKMIDLTTNDLTSSGYSFDCASLTQDPNLTANNYVFDVLMNTPQGELIDTITTDLNSRETSACSTYNTSETIASFMNSIEDMGNINDNLDTGLDMSAICSLPESELKLKLLYATNGAKGTISDFKDDIQTTTDDINSMTNNILGKIGVDLTNGTDIPMSPNEWFLNNIPNDNALNLSSEDQYYGIPLIELDAGSNESGSNANILQINTHSDVGWKLEVTNIGTFLGSKNEKLIIDKQIPPGVKFIAGFITDGIAHTLYLHIQLPGEEPIQKTIRRPHEFTINSFGADTRQLKNLCGYIHDIWVMDWKSSLGSGKIPGGLSTPPQYPYGALAFYDFYHTRVDRNLVHEQREMLNPVRIGGLFNLEWNTFSDTISEYWKFMQNGYLEDFFCRRKFLNRSFSIIWHSQLESWGRGIQYIISDDINHNYLYYDYNSFEFVLKFNKVTKKYFRVIPPKSWNQFSLRYNMDTGNLILGILDFGTLKLETTEVIIGEDLKFELMSMLAMYNVKEKEYTNKYNCSFGMLILYDKFIEDVILQKLYDEENFVIRGLLPYGTR